MRLSAEADLFALNARATRNTPCKRIVGKSAYVMNVMTLRSVDSPGCVIPQIARCAKCGLTPIRANPANPADTAPRFAKGFVRSKWSAPSASSRGVLNRHSHIDAYTTIFRLPLAQDRLSRSPTLFAMACTGMQHICRRATHGPHARHRPQSPAARGVGANGTRLAIRGTHPDRRHSSCIAPDRLPAVHPQIPRRRR